MELHLTEILEVSNKGRIRLFGNSWFDLKSGYKPDVEIKPGCRYRFSIDMALRIIHEVKPIEKLEDLDTELIGLLYAEIDRLTAIADNQRRLLVKYHGLDEYQDMMIEQGCYGRIDDNSLQGEIRQIERIQELASIKRDKVLKRDGAGWISYTSNPGIVKQLWNRLGREDRLKGNGRDIRSRIADFCEFVPGGLLPPEIREHMQGQYECDHVA